MYDFFNKIICINLSTRPDKKRFVAKTFEKLHIPDVEYYIAIQNKNGGRYGCFESHINVIYNAFNNGYSYILIFEDDIYPTYNYNKKHIKNATDFLATQPDVDILQLGHFPFQNENGLLNPYIKSKRIPNFPNILQFAGTGAHAYCITKSGMKKVLESNWKKYINEEHYDIFLAKLGLNHYVYVPTLFDQNLCLESNNIPISKQERFIRSYGCIISDYQMNHKVSIVKYYENYIKLFVIFILIGIFLYFLYINCVK